MILSIAWKNVWRNKLRSFIVIFAVMIGILAGSFGVALMEGMSKKRTKSMIHNEYSHIQVHHSKFPDNNETKYFIEKTEQFIYEIKKNTDVVAATGRILISGMINTAGGNAGVFVYGINPENEKQVTDIHKFVKNETGNYFEKNKKNSVLIGEELAKKIKLDRYMISESILKQLAEKGITTQDTGKLRQIINVKFRTSKKYLQKLKEILGEEITEKNKFYLTRLALQIKSRSRVVITFQDKNGELTGAKFKITGIYKTKNAAFDEMSVFVRKSDLARLTKYDKSVSHEIAILLNEKYNAQKTADFIRKKFPKLKTETWGELNPELIMLAEYMVIYNYILVAIILAALAFGIINTMLMAIMERTKELGMLAAVGMNRKKVFNMIMTETLFLTITGAIVGLIINFLLISHLAKTGIDLSASMGEAFEAIGYDPIMYPEMGFNYYIGITLLVFFTAVISSVFPALKAVRLNPAEAVRSDA